MRTIYVDKQPLISSPIGKKSKTIKVLCRNKNSGPSEGERHFIFSNAVFANACISLSPR